RARAQAGRSVVADPPSGPSAAACADQRRLRILRRGRAGPARSRGVPALHIHGDAARRGRPGRGGRGLPARRATRARGRGLRRRQGAGGGAAWPDHGADGAPCRPLPHAAASVLGAARCPPCLPRCGRPGAVFPARGATRTLVAGRGSGGPVLSSSYIGHFQRFMLATIASVLSGFALNAPRRSPHVLRLAASCKRPPNELSCIRSPGRWLGFLPRTPVRLPRSSNPDSRPWSGQVVHPPLRSTPLAVAAAALHRLQQGFAAGLAALRTGRTRVMPAAYQGRRARAQ